MRDSALGTPAAEWQAVEEELRLRDPAIVQRPMPMVVTKMDLPAVRDRWPALRNALVAAGHQPLDVSAHDGSGLEALRDVLRRALAAVPPDKAIAGEPPVRVHRFDPLDEGWQVVGEDAALRVLGRRIETAAARTDFENEESRDRFQRLLERSGIDAELRRRGARAGTPVRIGAVELEWDDDE